MIKFGTDGWRAIIGEEFTFANVAKVAQAYADFLTSQKNSNAIILGFDRRFLSDRFAQTIASVLAANHLKVSLSNTYCPTPCVSWMTKKTQAAGGVMVTASHNPFSWNGIKFKESYGGSASTSFTSQIEKAIKKNEAEKRSPLSLPFEEAVKKGNVTFFDPLNDYIHQLRSQIDVSKIQQAHWKIAYDPLYGAGIGFLNHVLKNPVTEIHSEHNPGFGDLHPEPIEKNLKELSQFVKKGDFDVGLATDGDADRIGAVDENGNFVTPHQIYALILLHLLEKGMRGDIIKTVSTTMMIDAIAHKYDLKVHETPIGFKHICTKLLEVTPLIGGEESGGIGIPSHVYERDGLLSGLLLLEIMSVKKKRLGELLADLEKSMGSFYFLREDVHLTVEEDIAFKNQKLSDKKPDGGGRKIKGIHQLDGTKYLFDDGSWLLVRPSGTEPLVRIYAESSQPAFTKHLIQEGRRLLNLYK